MTATTWEQKAKSKQTQTVAEIPPEWTLPAAVLLNSAANVLDVPRTCGLLTEKEIHITEDYDATGLLEKLAAGGFSSVEVTTAFCKRAAIAQQLTCCLTEMFFDKALARAKQLDEVFARTGVTTGPLHGLPISIKESFNVPGVPTTLGFVGFLDRPPASTSSALVEILNNSGAVLYVKTNIPQTMMTPDSHNNVFGRVLNPHGRSLTAGGSSGGEGALVAMRGSILGVGTDIAGSVRIPALCCGVFGFKPTACRVPYAGQTSAGRPGMTGIFPSAGPLCHSIRDAELFLRVVLNSRPPDLDDLALDVPWSPAPPKETLTIGLLPEDPSLPLHPPMRRTLDAAVKALTAAGHRVIDLSAQAPSLSSACSLALRYFGLDPDRTALRHITQAGEPFIPSLKFTYDLNEPTQEPTLRDLFDLNVARGQFAAQARKLFVENQLDLLLGAAYQSTSVPHDTYGRPTYTVLWNLVNYPACVLPFGKADKVADEAYRRNVTYVPDYRPEEIDGAPCHIHLIGRPMADERLVQDAATVSTAIKATINL
ncbi:amidase signature domain-containing protein [Aspergillus pseudonomiae]|nr:amidase signature domain-containing protein [Aspergillus pseudonomiae]